MSYKIFNLSFLCNETNYKLFLLYFKLLTKNTQMLLNSNPALLLMSNIFNMLFLSFNIVPYILRKTANSIVYIFFFIACFNLRKF